MRSTHTDNQTCIDTTITVHTITLAVLHLNRTLAVLHLNPTLAVLHLNPTLAVFHRPRDPSLGHAEEAEPKTSNGLEEEATEGKSRRLTLYSMDTLRKRLHCAKVGEDGKNKIYKSSGSSSFNTKESGEGSINLNTTVEDEEGHEVEEVRRPKHMGRDQAKRKMKAGSASSASSFDVEALAKMMASEYVMASDSYNIQKNQEMSELLKIKKQELELKAAELEIRRMKNRQRDEALYGTTNDEELKARLRQRLFG
ncbi:hypothetical protein Tco_0538672 [Tanacetum coccineum]